MTQTKKKIIIKFYKLAATKNKQESTIRNESEALTESALRTITLMQSQGLKEVAVGNSPGAFPKRKEIFSSCHLHFMS